MPEDNTHSRVAEDYAVLNEEVKGEKAETTWATNPARIKALCNSFHFTHNGYYSSVAKVSVQPKISSSADVI